MSTGNFIAGLIFLLTSAQVIAFELLMVEEKGCYWCERWDKEISVIYPKTNAGQYAPLRRVDISALPGDISFNSDIMFTPTFILIDDDLELARIEGYPGEDFFWPLLEDALTAHTAFKENRP